MHMHSYFVLRQMLPSLGAWKNFRVVGARSISCGRSDADASTATVRVRIAHRHLGRKEREAEHLL